MNLRFFGAFALGAIAAVEVLAWGSSHFRQPKPGACIASSDSRMAVSLSLLKQYLADPQLAPERAQDGFPNDSMSVSIVQNDSICRRAAIRINAHREVAESTHRAIYLFSIGGKAYWAEDTTGMDGRFVGEYSLDSALTRIRKVSVQ